MPRPPRVEFPDALYHVTARGTQKAPIVLDDGDRLRWMEYLKEAVLRFALELYAFVLMTNHFHLFVATPRANLHKAMQYLNGSWAMYFNVRHKRGGHLFERRYRAILVEDQGHYSGISRYVQLNPVRAGIVERPEEYPWSTYVGYHWGRTPLLWVNYDRVLEEFGKGKEARKRYREFVADGIGKEVKPPWHEAIGGWLLGSRKFAARVYATLNSGCSDSRWGSRAVVPERPLEATLDEIASAVSKVFGVDDELLKSPVHPSRDARSAFILIARDMVGMRVRLIGDYVGISATGSASQAIQRARCRNAKDKQFHNQTLRIESLLRKAVTAKGV